jgi:hypothetical protein
MSFLLPEGKHWGVANWVSRGFFADAEPFLHEAPSLADDIRFCIQAETDTVDLRLADHAILRELLALVERVIAAARNAGPSSFHNPNAYPVYLQRVEQLRDIVRTLSAPGA